MAASIATALAKTGRSAQSQLQASKLATKRELAGGASTLGSQATSNGRIQGRIGNAPRPSTGNLIAPQFGSSPQAAQAGNRQIAQNIANQPSQIPQFYGSLGTEQQIPEPANTDFPQQSTLSQYQNAAQTGFNAERQRLAEFQQNQYLARLQAQVEAKQAAEQAQQEGPADQLKNMATDELSRFLWRGGSLATIAEWEGLMLWMPSGLGVVVDGISAAKTIFPQEKQGVLYKITPPALEATNILDLGIIVKLGVMLLLLTAIAGIVMLFIAVILGAAAGLTYVTSILGETIVGFLTNSVLGV